MKTIIAIALISIALFSGCSKNTDTTTRAVAPCVVRTTYTGSMEPTIHGGELIAISPIDINAVAVGDIVAYWEEARQINILHRVVSIRRTPGGVGLVCRGDANWDRDLHVVTADMLIGRATLPR